MDEPEMDFSGENTNITEEELNEKIYDYLVDNQVEKAILWASQVKQWDLAYSELYVKYLLEKGNNEKNKIFLEEMKIERSAEHEAVTSYSQPKSGRNEAVSFFGGFVIGLIVILVLFLVMIYSFFIDLLDKLY